MKKLFTWLVIFTGLLSAFSVKANDYYWVGGSGNWSAFATHWATTSGGTTFHTQIPQSIDNVYFDANSFTAPGQTVTLDITNAVCKDMNWTGVSNMPTFNGVNRTIKILGSLAYASGMTITNSPSINFEATTTGQTIKSAGKALGYNVNFDGTGGGWTLLDPLISNTTSLNLTKGSFNTNGQALTVNQLLSSNSNTRSLTLGSSIITVLLGSSGTTMDLSGTGLTFSGGTSTINLPGNYGFFYAGTAKTYNIVNFTGTGGAYCVLNGNNNIFNTVNSSTNQLHIQGTNTIGTATLGGDVNFSGNNSFGTLNLNKVGGIFTFQAGATQTITTALSVAGGSCNSFANFISSTAGTQATISMASGSVTVDYLNIKDIKGQGGASFTVNNAIDQGNNTGWTINALASKNLYWVGGTGNWSDGAHWSLTSGGASLGCSPNALDNVFFDANSFTAPGQTVTLDITNAVCKDMNWTGVSNMPTFNGVNRTIKILGSLAYASGMTITNSPSINFEATTTGQTIKSAGKALGYNVNFDGTGGGWTLLDPLISNTTSLNLTKGSFNTNGQALTVNQLLSSNSNTRSLTLGSSIITVLLGSSGTTMDLSGTGLTFSGGTSTINLPGNYGFFYAGTAKTYNIVNFTGTGGAYCVLNGNNNIFNTVNSSTNQLHIQGTNTIGTATLGGDVNFSGNNSFGTLNLNKVGGIFTFQAGATQTITTALSVAGGSCNSFANFISSTAGTQATISMASGSVTVDYLNIKDIKGQGGASFTVNNAIDQGNNTGWTINALASKNLYWVGGTGNWSDGAHWSLTSGGASLGCSPNALDNVFFDANSFTAPGQTVTLDITNAVCKDMNWTGVSNMPTFNGVNRTIKIFGSLAYASGMTITNSPSINFEATTTGQTIKSAGKALGYNVNFDGTGGGWTLLDPLISNTTSLNLTKGSFNTNGQALTVNQLLSSNSNTRSLTLGSSIITVLLGSSGTTMDLSGTGLTFSGGTSTINLPGNYGFFYAGTAKTYNIVNFTGTGGAYCVLNGNNNIFNTVNSSTNQLHIQGTNTIGTATLGGDVNFSGNNSFGTLNLNKVGGIFTFQAGATQTITTALSITGGSGGNPVFLSSSSAGTQATISMASGSFCTDYIRTKDIKAIGGASFVAGPSSQNIGNTTGWTFISGVPNPTVSITANTGTTTCLGNPVTFTAAFTNGGLSRTYQWFVNGVSVQNSASNTYTASNLANGAAVYCVISALPTTCSFALVVNSNTLNMSLSNVAQSVSIGASATSIVSGTSVTFTATPTNGGSSPLYQWQKNGSNVGTNSATYNDATLANSDVITCIMTSSITCVTTPTATSNSVAMTVSGPPSVQATNVNFSGTTATQTTIGWTNGNGALRAVFVSESTTGQPAPLDATTYTASTVFGSGTQIGSSGWYCVYIGSGTSVTVTGLSTSGTIYQAMVLEYTGGAGNEQYLTATSTGNQNSTSGINSITKIGSSPNNASSVQYAVSFGASLTGLTTSNFSLSTSGSVSGASISSLSGSGTSYTITVNTGTGDGNITLNLANDSGVSPVMTTTLPFAGEPYTIDKTPPVVTSITRVGLTPNNATSDQFTVTFGEGVAGVSADDFSLTATGSIAGTIGTVSALSASVYTVTVTGVSGDGTLRLDLNGSSTGIADLAGNAIGTGFTSGQVYSIDQTGPTVSSVSVPANLTYIEGQNLDFTVNFDQAVIVNTSGGTPYLNITLATGTVQAAYTSGSGSTGLAFRYTVAIGDNDNNGIALSALTLNSGTLQDGAGNNASLTLNSIGSTTDVLVDALAPTVASVSVPANATYLAAQNLDFTLNFSENVMVTAGIPSVPITLNTGGTVNAGYLSGTGTSALIFRYTVTSGKEDLDGISIGTSISLNGGTIKDAAAHNATLALNSVGSTTAVLVDALAPTVSSVAVPANASYKAGQNLDFTVNISEAVTVNTGGGTPYIPVTLNTGGTVQAAYISGSGSSALVFRYTVAAGNADPNGISLGGAITLNSGTIRDAAANNATLTLNSVGSTTNVLVDAIAPVVSSINRAGTSPTTAASVNYTVTISESVTGVDITDFILTPTGTANGTISAISGSGATYTVTVNSITGTGTLRLDLNSSGTGIIDAATNAISGGYTSGQTYSVSPSIPTIQATNVTFASTTTTGTTASWTNGNGASRVVFVRAASSGGPTPVNASTYTANAAFGSGTQIGSTGWYCVYNGTGTSVTISGLATETAYQVMTLEYNGPAGNEQYLTSTATGNPATVTTLSSVATLSNLGISSGTLAPVFSAGTTAYVTSVTNATTTVTVTPTKTNANATIKVNGTTVSSGSASGNISLNVGSNIITTVVTAQDGTTMATYTVNVTRAASSNASLSGLSVSVGTLAPVFASATTSYTVSLGSAASSTTLTPIVQDATATVQVNGVTVTSGTPSGSIALTLSSNTITTVVTAQDGTTTKTYTVTVTDQTPPVALTKNITLSLDASGNATITPASVDNGSTDNVGITTYSLDKSAFNCSNVGANTVTLTVTDAAGNASTATAVVTVQDNVPPIAIAQAITVQLDATGNATITPAQINNSSTDNCAIATYALDKTTFDCSNVGANTVTLTVKDASGNISTATAVVTVQDNVPPIPIAQAITVQLDATGNATITPAQINNGSTDNCAIATYALDKTTFSCSNLGANTVTLTVTDIHGNASTTTAVVTIQDNVPPIAIAQAITVQLDATGNATITPAQINNGSTDNCAIATYALDKTTFNCSNVGANTVTLTVKDIHGNASTATAVVTVQDNVPPIAIAQAITVQLNAAGNATITPAQINYSSTDNCAIATYALDKTTFDCSNVGANTVTLTVTDAAGNASTATAVVTIQDNVPPIAIAQAITVQLDATGNATITPAQINNSSTDNCAIATYALNKTTFNCSNVGANTVTLTVTDIHGNASIATAVVTVQDNVPPIAIAQAITVQLDAAGNATITPAQINYSSTDNCAIATYALDKTTFDCSNVGANTVTLTVTDIHGNTSTATAVVTVQDLVPPIAIAQAITVQLDATGNATITPAQINYSSNDNCAIATYALDKTTFNCSNVGANTVTLTVTDIHGNASTATAVVTIQDNVPPIAIAQAITVQLNATGNATITPAQINYSSTDNCAIATYALDKTTFNCSNVGANTVTLTVKDIHGNASTATAVVTIQDNVPPVVITKNITVYLSGGNATITPAQINNGSTDNCAIATYALDKTTFDCSNVGANTVTLTVTDNNGNVSTKPAVVTVIGMTPTPSIAVSRTDNTNTNLDANTIALGYGAQNLTLTASNPNSAPGASTYLWSPSAGLSNASIANPVFTPTQAGSYTFNVLVTSEYGCQASASVTITVIDARCEKGKVLVCHNTGSASNPYVQTCISTNAVATQLAKGGILGTCQTMTVNEKIMVVAGSDFLKVSTERKGTKDVVSPLDQPKLSASNILSPNNDGQNDTWVISNLDKYPYNKVTIVDRRGKVVYTKENYRNDWDGTFNTGILPEDTYYYIVDFGKGISQLKGFISIVK